MAIVSVLLVDDHPVVRAGVRAVLEAAEGIRVVGEAAAGEEALEVAGTLRPDVALVDLRLGAGLDGVGVTRAMRAEAGGPAVVILTTYDHDADIVRAVEAGAAGYLLKDAPPAAIVTAVREAAAGSTVLTPEVQARVVAGMRTRRPVLSARELDVVRLLAQGLANRQIARALVVSEATVKTHLVHVYDKLGVDNRTAAVARARQVGLLDG